jgi:glutamate/tyrosine decarboxylase-like PLP-dependent enzyme
MTACRIYRNWGYHSKGIPCGRTVIIAPATVHAAVNKAGFAYDITIVLARTNICGEIDLFHMEELLRLYGNRVVAIFGSAPSYSTGNCSQLSELDCSKCDILLGIVDPISRLGQLALKYHIGLHVGLTFSLRE